MLQAMDAEDFKSGNEQKMDEQLMVRFLHKEREDKTATLKEGRPIFKEVEYVEIRVRGARDPQACRPATYADKQRFPRHYEAFQKRIELPESGTPLAQWPQINRSQVEEMAFLGVKTVEQLVELSDGHAAKFRNGYSLKRLAKEFMAFSGETKMIAENDALKQRISDLENRLNALSDDRIPDAAIQGPDAPAQAPAQAPVQEQEDTKPIARRSRKK